ncbi:MAG: hypothetical protein MJ249_07135 [Kiritimatiellae bacterium]|nr:hypothetical protein [Kiritimatiellia bacterium]
MKKVLVVSVFVIVTFVRAAQSMTLFLPPVEKVDTEATTNVVISSWQRGAAKFVFSLSCLATPSNNVEATFGEDVKLKMENVK